MSNTENKVRQSDVEIHDWYRFVLSYPPHLVQQYLTEFNIDNNSLVLDPFCGTGTTNVECKKSGIASVGVEASPITYFASCVKCDFSADCSTGEMQADAQRIAATARENITSSPVRHLTKEQEKLILKNSISEQPLSETLYLRDAIYSEGSKFQDYFLLALAKHTVQSYSNLKFGPEVGVSRKKKLQVDVVSIWLEQVLQMEQELIKYHHLASVNSDIIHGDARNVDLAKYQGSIDCVITSPPYPNEKDYSRTTRLESVILGFIKNKDDLRSIKKGFIRSNSKNVYKEDTDEQFIGNISSIIALSDSIERRRIELNKTSGFEKLYSRVVKLYFGGMARHLISIKPLLKHGAMLAYVVGDQASYFQIPIRTSQLLGEVAESIGDYTVVRIDTFRKRYATATDTWLNEDVLILKYMGGKNEQV